MVRLNFDYSHQTRAFEFFRIDKHSFVMVKTCSRTWYTMKITRMLWMLWLSLNFWPAEASPKCNTNAGGCWNLHQDDFRMFTKFLRSIYGMLQVGIGFVWKYISLPSHQLTNHIYWMVPLRKPQTKWTKTLSSALDYLSKWIWNVH